MNVLMRWIFISFIQLFRLLILITLFNPLYLLLNQKHFLLTTIFFLATTRIFSKTIWKCKLHLQKKDIFFRHVSSNEKYCCQRKHMHIRTSARKSFCKLYIFFCMIDKLSLFWCIGGQNIMKFYLLTIIAFLLSNLECPRAIRFVLQFKLLRAS